MNFATWILTASLLAAALAAQPVSAACGDLDDRCTYPSEEMLDNMENPACPLAISGPSEPEPGYVPMTRWYAKTVNSAACNAVYGMAAPALDATGDVLWSAGSIAANPDDAQAFAVLLANSAYVDTCESLLGPGCGNDSPPFDGSCPSGVAVPQVFPGGLVGETTQSADEHLQGTCGFTGVPTEVSEAAAQLPGHVQNRTERLAQDVNDATCVLVFGATC